MSDEKKTDPLSRDLLQSGATGVGISDLLFAHRRLLHEPCDFSRHLQVLLQQLGTHWEADRTYLFLLNGDQETAESTLTWCRKGVSLRSGPLQKIDLHAIHRWMPFFSRRESVVVSDLEEMQSSQPGEYERMKGQNIHSYVEAPIFCGETWIGFIGADNPAKDQILHTGELLSSLAYFISAAMVGQQKGQQTKILRQAEARRWAEANRYRQELALFYRLGGRDLIAKGHHNLTRNRILDYIPMSGKALDLDGEAPFSAAYASFPLAATQAQDRTKLGEMISRRNLISLYAQGQNSVSMEFPRETADHRIIWVRVEIRTFQAPDTDDIECFIYTYDVTQSHFAQILMQRMTTLGYDYLGMIDPVAQTYTFCGLRFPSSQDTKPNVFDYKSNVLSMTKAHVPAEEQLAVLEAASLAKITAELEKGVCYSFSCNFIDSDKTMRRKQLQYCYLDQEADSIFFCASDITKQYAVEQEQLHCMKKALDAAQKADRAKTEFVSRLSHDIRTSIGIISNMARFAQEDMDNHAKLEHDLNRIETSTTFLLRLINDVLDLSKISSDKIALHPEPYSLEEHDTNVHNILEPLCAERGLTYHIVRRNRAKDVIVADKVCLNQIILNLLSNAVKYTPPDGTVTYHSASEPLPDGQIRFCFEVCDTGIGMSEAFQKHMFEPFTQEYDNPDRQKGLTGTGLGLAIVKRDVELMDGTLTVHSTLGKGTSIQCNMVFPDALRDSRYHPAQQTPPQPSAEQVPPLSGKVLLAEDNDINAEIAMRILESFGLEVLRVENGAEAVVQFQSSQVGEYRAILMDSQMPVLNGYEATARIRSLPHPDAASISVIAMTADSFADAAERGRRAGMNAYVTKPLDPVLLRTCLTGKKPDI